MLKEDSVAEKHARVRAMWRHITCCGNPYRKHPEASTQKVSFFCIFAYSPERVVG